MKKLIFTSICFVLIFGLFSCKDDDNPADSNGDGQLLKISHWGVDWSEGEVASQDMNNPNFRMDGETIGWCPNGDGGGWDTGIWYRCGSDQLYRMGSGSLGDYNKIDISMYDDDVCDTPLAKDDVWASKCSDGYVIFKVMEQPDLTSQDWAVEVSYKFSTTVDF
jgi:hypothetical protein